MGIDWSQWDDDPVPRPPVWKRPEVWLWGAMGMLACLFAGRLVLDMLPSDVLDGVDSETSFLAVVDREPPANVLEATPDSEGASEPSTDQALVPTAATPDTTLDDADRPDDMVLASAQGGLDTPVGTRAGERQNQREWVQHEVIPGERVADIAARYQVSGSAIIRWNKLNAKNPRLRVGQTLKVWAKRVPPPRERITYTVERGDSWIGIARKFGVERGDLRRWNYKTPSSLRPGQRLRLWVDRVPTDRAGALPGTSPAPTAALPMVNIKSGAVSIGTPNRGKIANAIQLPSNDALYRISNPDHAWGTTHTFQLLQLAIASFRTQSGYQGDVIVGAISRRGGGRFRPHRSHQSGRDVDIWLPVRRGVANKSRPERADEVDWDAAWALMSAFIDTGQVEYIFLNYARQRQLYQAARRAGVPQAKRDALIQFPERNSRQQALVRHAEGHESHFHVRLKCARHELRCLD